MAFDDCISIPVLQMFLAGQLSEEESRPLEEHLLNCQACVERARQLPAAPWRALVKAGPGDLLSGPESHVEEIEDLLRREGGRVADTSSTFNDAHLGATVRRPALTRRPCWGFGRRR